ncbi:MAG: winged helix-turn-helix domain-containing protein [Candidatus Dormibacteria bacterium]
MSNSPPDPTVGLRRISDAKTMRALSHPVRLALIEALTLDGPLTATEASELISESPTTCSFHLRQLARYGFVEEAGGGPGRNRPWKMSSVGMTASARESDGEADSALAALRQLFRERYFSRLEAFERTRHLYPKEWRDVAGEGEFVLYVTPQEADEVQRGMVSLLMRYQERLGRPELRPEGSQPLEVLAFLYPFRPPQGGPTGPRRRARRDPKKPTSES